MNNHLKFTIMKIKLLGIFTIAMLAFTAPSFAQTGKFDKNHPRRAEVNHRLANQNRRIDNKVKDGKMSKAEAHHLRSNDHKIRQEERDMASQNHGHISKQEQRTLNQQENHNSRKIRNH